jgi:NADPH:quinone reductase-like Zn-dependent oxidoreductase
LLPSKEEKVKAVYLNKLAGYEELVFGEIPRPRPGRGEVLVQVHATAITPTEFQWFPTFKAKDGNPRPFPIVQSHEFSGLVAAVGKEVIVLNIGDAVYGMNDWYANGAQARYCIAPATAVASKPRTLDHAQSAVVPISALTAWQGLFDHARLTAGQRVLIHGGAGGVGVFAVQLAHWRGAHVIATASARNLAFVRELGADEVIDYKTTRFEEVVRDLDVVFDVIGGETLARSWNVLKPGGRVVTIAAQSEATTDERTRAAFFIVEPSPPQLAEVAQLLDAGKVRSFVEAVFPLARTREAYAHAVRGNLRGKVAIQVVGND